MTEGESLELFDCLKKSKTSLHYIDEENSVIPIGSAWELEEAARLAKIHKKPIKLFLSDNKTQTSYTMYLNVSNSNKGEKSTDYENSSDSSNVKTIPEGQFYKLSEHTCNNEAPPDWFLSYMNKFKKDLLSEVKSSIVEVIENTLKKKKKKSLLKVDDVFCVSCPLSPDKAQTKKKYKISEKDSVDVMDQKGYKVRKLEKLISTKSEKLEKLDSKSKLLLEERRKILEKKRSSKSKIDKSTLDSSEKKNLLQFSAAFLLPEVHLRLQPEKDFIVPVGVINNGLSSWRYPEIECFDFGELHPDPLYMSIPMVRPGQKWIILLQGKSCKAVGLHHFKCRILENMKVISPEFTCYAKVECDEPEVKQSNAFSNAKSNNLTQSSESVDHVNDLKDVIDSSERKITENIKKIKEKLRHIDLIETPPATFELGAGKEYYNKPQSSFIDREDTYFRFGDSKIESMKEQKNLKKINKDTTWQGKPSPYSMINLKDSLSQYYNIDEQSLDKDKEMTEEKEKHARALFNSQEKIYGRVTEDIIKNKSETDYMRLKSPPCSRDNLHFHSSDTKRMPVNEKMEETCKDKNEEIQHFKNNNEYLGSSSDSEASLICLSDNENFILVNVPSRSLSPAESVHEDKKSVTDDTEDRSFAFEEPLESIVTKKKLSEPKIEQEMKETKIQGAKNHDIQAQILNGADYREVKRNPEKEALKSVGLEDTWKRGEGEIPKDFSPSSPTFLRSRRSPFGEDISKSKNKKIKSKSTEYHFTTANLTQPTFSVLPETVSAGPSQFIFTGEREEVKSHSEASFDGKPTRFTFTKEKEERSNKEGESRKHVRKTDSVGRVIYAVNSSGYCLPVDAFFEVPENHKEDASSAGDDRNQTRYGKRNVMNNENPSVNILPHVLVNGASNVASIAFNTAKSVISNLQFAFVTEGKTELGKPAFEEKKKVSPEEALFILYEMGFLDFEKNRKLLHECENDLRKVVGELVRQSKSSE